MSGGHGGGGGLIAQILPLVISVALVIALTLVILISLVIAIVLYPMLSFIGDWMSTLVNKTLIPVAIWGISINPDVSIFETLVEDLIKLLSGFYIIALIVTGIYIIFISSSPEHRARAKSMLLRLLLGLALVTVSLPIFEILLSIGSALTKRILANVALESGGAYVATATFVVIYVLWSFVVPLILLLAVMSVGLRYVIVCFMAVLFPITIFLYFFELTRGIGSNMFRYTIMAIIAQPVMALMLAITLGALNSVTMVEENYVAALMSIFIAVAGFFGVAAAPLITLGVMSWLGGAAAGYGMYLSFTNPRLGGAMVAMGGLAAGMGPEALVVGYSAKALGTHALDTKVMNRQRKTYMEAYYARNKKLPGWDHMNEEIMHMRHSYQDIHDWEKAPGFLREKYRPGYKGWSPERIELEKKKLDEVLHVEGWHELHEAESMTPYPLRGVQTVADRFKKGRLYGLAGQVGEKIEGVYHNTSLGQRSERYKNIHAAQSQIASIDAAENSLDAAGKLKEILVRDIGIPSQEAERLAGMVGGESSPEAAKEKAKSLIVYSRIKKDNFPGCDQEFFNKIEGRLKKGDANVLSKEEFVNELDDYYAQKRHHKEVEIAERKAAIKQTHQSAYENDIQKGIDAKDAEKTASKNMGAALQEDEKKRGATDQIQLEAIDKQHQKAVDSYLNDYDHYHKVYGKDKAELFAAANAYGHEVGNQMANIPPEVVRDWENALSDTAKLEFRMDLGSNLHARMLLEDYMGIGPRPSEFYQGIGPDTMDAWEKQKEKSDKLSKGDKETWERI